MYYEQTIKGLGYGQGCTCDNIFSGFHLWADCFSSRVFWQSALVFIGIVLDGILLKMSSFCYGKRPFLALPG